MGLKDKILELRDSGKSYNEISESLDCSKGTVAYHCGDGQKQKGKDRQRKHRSHLLGILKRKKDNFSFVNGNRMDAGKRAHLDFSAEEFKDKLEKDPICYLTGRKIDLMSPKSYHCDHIIPVSNGGKCTMDNLGLACREANISKAHMSLEEYIQLCKEVLIHHGYTVS